MSNVSFNSNFSSVFRTDIKYIEYIIMSNILLMPSCLMSSRPFRGDTRQVEYIRTLPEREGEY